LRERKSRYSAVSALKKAPRIPPSAITGGRHGLLRGTWPRLATVSGPSFCPQTKNGSCEAALVRIGRKIPLLRPRSVQRNQKPPNLTRVPPNSKAVGGEPANGFAFVPHTCEHVGLSDRQRQGANKTSERTVSDNANIFPWRVIPAVTDRFVTCNRKFSGRSPCVAAPAIS